MVIFHTHLALGHPRLGYLHVTEPCQVLVLYDARSAAHGGLQDAASEHGRSRAAGVGKERKQRRGEGLEMGGWREMYLGKFDHDLTATSLEIMVNKGNHPQMALIQVSEIL